VVTKTTLTFQLQPTFFGLSNEYLENVYDQIFTLQYYSGWSFTEAYNLPIKLREWFVKKIVSLKEEEQRAIQEASPGHGGTHEIGPGNIGPTRPKGL